MMAPRWLLKFLNVRELIVLTFIWFSDKFVRILFLLTFVFNI